jgi:hypothetical protein
VSVAYPMERTFSTDSENPAAGLPGFDPVGIDTAAAGQAAGHAAPHAADTAAGRAAA